MDELDVVKDSFWTSAKLSAPNIDKNIDDYFSASRKIDQHRIKQAKKLESSNGRGFLLVAKLFLGIGASVFAGMIGVCFIADRQALYSIPFFAIGAVGAVLSLKGFAKGIFSNNNTLNR